MSEPRSSAPKNEAPLICTFPVAETSTEEGWQVKECGRRATTIYTVPVFGRLPRCPRHDTEIVQAEADLRGYTREELT
jgi:hypothetical protein